MTKQGSTFLLATDEQSQLAMISRTSPTCLSTTPSEVRVHHLDIWIPTLGQDLSTWKAQSGNPCTLQAHVAGVEQAAGLVINSLIGSDWFLLTELSSYLLTLGREVQALYGVEVEDTLWFETQCHGTTFGSALRIYYHVPLDQSFSCPTRTPALIEITQSIESSQAKVHPNAKQSEGRSKNLKPYKTWEGLAS